MSGRRRSRLEGSPTSATAGRAGRSFVGVNRSVNAAPNAAKQIEFPGRVEARIELRLVAAKRRDTLFLREALLRVRAVCGDGRCQIEARLAMECARLLDVSERDTQVVIREQRVVNQLVKGRVSKLPPEPGDRVLIGVACPFGVHERS